MIHTNVPITERTSYRGSRKIEKGERERKRVADIRNKVDVLRKRIDPEFMKGRAFGKFHSLPLTLVQV